MFSKIELDSTSSAQIKVMYSQDSDREASLHDDDKSLWNGSEMELDKSSDLDLEWQRRHHQFHTIGYRDGLTVGKEKKLLHKRDLILGLSNLSLLDTTGVLLEALPDDILKEKLIETAEKRTEFQKLYESAKSLSTTDALRLFNDAIVAEKITEEGERAEASSYEGDITGKKIRL